MLLLAHLGLASFQLILCIELLCPSTSQWFKRAKTVCKVEDHYYCLYDDNHRNYKEICLDTPTFDSAGYKAVIVGGIQGVSCENDKYQPFKYWTNGSSTCAFKKNHCNAEGQVIYDNGTTKTDRQCRCDYSRGYDFIKKPKHTCYCEPSKEDCSCYRKQCPSDFVLTPDYNCKEWANWSMKSTCSMIHDNTDTRDNERTVMQIPKRNDEIGVKKPSSMFKAVLSKFIGFPNIMIFIYALLIILIVIRVFCHFTCMGVMLPILQDIIDLNIKVKEEWKTKFNAFIETKAFMAILKSIKQSQIVIVTGPDGCGKSSSTFHAALNLEKNDGFKMWIIYDTDDILKFSSAETKMIFLFDDAFGRYSVDRSRTKSLYQKDSSLINILKGNTNLKLVMTCRSYIYRSANKIETLKLFCHVDFLSASLSLTIQERRKIGECYINTENMKCVNDDVIMLYNFFPSLCARFSEINNEDMIEYFTFPISYIAEEVEQFRSLGDTVFLAFAVLIICRNKVNKNLFHSNNDIYKRMLPELLEELGFNGNSPNALLLSTFIAIQDVYVLEKTTWFESLHENLFLMISHCISPHMLRSIILYGESSFIQERLRRSSFDKNDAKFDILVPKQYKGMLSNRLRNGLLE